MPEQTDVKPFRERIGWGGTMTWREFVTAWEEDPQGVEAHFQPISAGANHVRPELKLTAERDTRPGAQTMTSGPPPGWNPKPPPNPVELEAIERARRNRERNDR